VIELILESGERERLALEKRRDDVKVGRRGQADDDGGHR
jgi:hypothetical protein